jgi:pyruvate,water dikinase
MNIMEQFNDTSNQLGGKANNLMILQKEGFNVPQFFVVSFQELLAYFNLTNEDIRLFHQKNATNKDGFERHTEELRSKAQLASIQTLRAQLDSFFGEDYLISIRSSVSQEDGKKASFAGLFESELFVKNSTLEEKLETCFFSLFDKRVFEYCRLHSLEMRLNEMNLIFQQMIEPSYAGVVFTMNVNGNLDDILISVAKGTGDNVVENKGDSENYQFNRNEKVGYPLEESNEILDEQSVIALSKLALQIEKAMNGPQDIEFCVDSANEVWVMQARPITALALEDIKILDNSNIVESYPGMTMPLSFSFAQNAYEQVFGSAAQLFKLPQTKLLGLKKELSQMITHFNGRVYYNLHHWYKVMQEVIASKKSLNAWENLIGIQSKKKTHKANVVNKLRLLWISFFLLMRFNKLVKSFFTSFEHLYAEMREYIATIENKEPKDVFSFYEKISKRLFGIWGPTLLNDFFTFKSFDLLDRFTKKHASNECSVNDLICGIPHVQSEELFQSLLDIAVEIRNNDEYLELFRNENDYILNHMDGNLNKLIYSFIDQYGDRTLEELKMESPNFRMRPDLFIQLLKTQVHTTITAESVRERQRGMREKAELSIKNSISKSPIKQIYFKYILSLTRNCIRNRENMRLQRARAYGGVKEMFWAIGKKLVREGVLGHHLDIYYLRIDELKSLVVELDKTVIPSIEHRKKEFNSWSKLSLPNRIMYTDIPPIIRTYQVDASNEEGRYHGMRISKGKLRKECIVLSEASFTADVDDKILITKMTDPAWVFLMTRAAGIISETGSPLSHTAIVGRELGIPVLINVKHATSVFKTGDKLHLNADEGWVEKL